ncbi:hypothetical protein, partial [Bradyrhizobium sp. Leaf401]
RSPLKDEPGWATHTPFPNFGKAEYFLEEGLTRRRNRPEVLHCWRRDAPQHLFTFSNIRAAERPRSRGY